MCEDESLKTLVTITSFFIYSIKNTPYQFGIEYFFYPKLSKGFVFLK